MPPPPVPEPQMTRMQALVTVGFFQMIDLVYLFLICLGWAGAALLHFCTEAGTLSVLLLVGLSLTLAQLWMITLCFRCMDFVLKTQADINLLPAAAARIVLGYQQQQP